MSRRSRKRGRSAGVGWVGKASIGLVIGAVVLTGVVFLAIRSYLHSEAFRSFLSAQVSRTAKVDGMFTPFRWQGLAVDADSFDATGTAAVRSLKVEGLHTEVGVGGIGRGVWQLKGSNIRRLEVDVDARNKDAFEDFSQADPTPRPKTPKKRWLPTDVEVMAADIQELVVRAELEQGPAVMRGMRVHAVPLGQRHSYRVETLGGAVRLPFPWAPEVRLDRTKLRYQDKQVFVNSASATVWKDGRLDAAGEWDIEAGQYTVEGGLSDVKCDELLNEDWAKRLTGDVASDFTIDNRGGSHVARGKLTIRNGTLTALPVLDTLAAYADTRRFRVLALTDAHTDWRWRDGELFLGNLVIASEGLIRLEGAMTVRGDELDGSFRLGLAPGTLASIPGAETHVFAPGERGLLWTSLRVSGKLDDPKEDLSDRLIAAAGARMFDVIPETGEKVIKFTRAVLGDSPGKAVEKGVKVIEEGTDIIRDVGGVLDGILGTGGRVPQPPPEDQDTVRED
jgi:hypothetical protein